MRQTMTVKDLAAILQRHPRNVRKLLKRFKVEPEFPARSQHRFTHADLQKLKCRMQKAYETARKTAVQPRNRLA
jgi:MarR-like DNA-binding transcriptional regulator SgrR of sgrS sRNA